MEAPITLLRLAQLLKMRKEARDQPYNLLLTSTLSLTPALLQCICQSDQWSAFCRYLQNLGRNDRMLALTPLLQSSHNSGYRALARLIAAGYFSTILTTNADSTLELLLPSILSEENTEPHYLQTLIVGRDTDHHIVQVLDDYSSTTNIRIVKLHGSLQDRILPATFPDIFELQQHIRTSVQRYLNQDLIIVGSLAHDHDVNRALTVAGHGTIYYVTPSVSASDDVVRLIEARGKRHETYVIDGQYGDFDTFFQFLEVELLSSSPSNSKSRVQAPSSEQHSPVITSAPHSDTAQEEPLRADILLVTVTEIETHMMLDVLQETCGNSYERCFLSDKTYYNLGVINGARVFLVQSEMGTTGPGGSLLTVQEGIQVLSPDAIIMVGIAFGMDPKKQRIGDILVAQRLRGYEMQRYGSSTDGVPRIFPREDLVPTSVRLLDRFRSGYKDWEGAPVHFGLLLSGDKLVDNQTLRDHLRSLEPEAIGGEMEGRGLYSVAQRYKIDWILVKAICDWGDGNKGRAKWQRQQKAARNAALFTVHVLQKTRLQEQ